MTDDFYLIAITALLPLTALMLVLQVNPYQALVMRGILGAIAALIYALFGAADVALTEALVGTMLSITLYAVAVRSSMEMRLGWVQPIVPSPQPAIAAAGSSFDDNEELENDLEMSLELQPAGLDETLVMALHQALKPHHLRLEILAYPSLEALQVALHNKRIHSAVLPLATADACNAHLPKLGPHRLQTRVRRLYEILSDRLSSDLAEVDYLDVAQSTPASASGPLGQPSPPYSAQESL